MRSRIIGIAALAAAVGGSAACGSPAPEPRGPARQKQAQQKQAQTDSSGQPPVQVVSQVSRTAVWVGDPIDWTVELVCAPTVDVIADDLAADKLELAGLELAGSETERITTGDGLLVHRVRYRLRAYEIGRRALRTGPLSVRYYARRPGQRAEDLAPAGQVQVPGLVLAWRSTIPEGVKVLGLRDARPSEQIPAMFRVARPIGLTLILASVAPVALWAASRVRAIRRPRERRPSRRASRNEAISAFGKLSVDGAGTDADCREAYARLNTIVRRHVAEVTGVPAFALTAEELGQRLRQQPSRFPGESIERVLAECDRACYGGPRVVPTADQFRESVDAVQRLV